METRIAQFKQFDINIKYRPGRENRNVDALSRMVQLFSITSTYSNIPDSPSPRHYTSVAIILIPDGRKLFVTYVNNMEIVGRPQSICKVLEEL